MNKSILITGVAGTGKSAVCDELNKFGCKAFGIEDIDGLFTMFHKKTGKPFKDYDNNDFARTAEVQDCLFGWKLWLEDHMKEKGAIVIDASRSLREVANDIIERSKSPK